MKILFFSMHMMQGGAERVISTLCNGELARNNDIYILTVLNSEPEFKLGSNIKLKGIIAENDYYGKGKVHTLPKVCKRYYRIVKKLQPDIIICFLPEPCFIAGIYRKKLGIPVIGSERGNPYYQFRKIYYKILGNILYNRADGFIFQTEGAKNFFIKPVRDKSVVIGNPLPDINLPKLLQSDRKKEIVAVGRFVFEKNYPMLIKAFGRVVTKYPDFKLRIYGKYSKDDEAVALIKELGLGSSVILEGPVDDVLSQINDKYAFVLSSTSEGLPNALMEAMAIGLPAVATDCPSGGPKQLIKDGINGLLVSNMDEEALANAMEKLIEDPIFAEKIGAEAKKIKDDYSEKKISSEWAEFIYKVIRSDR